jgi:hypothetical protein
MEETPMNEPQTVLPGWYAAQLSGEERWWDGGAWTSHTRPTPAAQPAAALPADQPGRESLLTELKRGSKEGSLIMAIFAVVQILPTSLWALWALVSGAVAQFLVCCLLVLLFASVSVYAFMSFLRIKREQDEAHTAYIAAVTQAQPSAEDA